MENNNKGNLMENLYKKSKVIHYLVNKANKDVNNIQYNFDKDVKGNNNNMDDVAVLNKINKMTQKTFLDSTWGVKIPRINAEFLNKLSNVCEKDTIKSVFELNSNNNNNNIQGKNDNILNIDNSNDKKIRFIILGSNKFCMDQCVQKIHNFIQNNQSNLNNKQIEISVLASTHTNREDNKPEDECAYECLKNLKNKLTGNKDGEIENNIKFNVYSVKKGNNKYVNTVDEITGLLSNFNNNISIKKVTVEDNKDYDRNNGKDYKYNTEDFLNCINIFVGTEPELTRQRADAMFSNLRLSAFKNISFYGVGIDEYIKNTIEYIKGNYKDINGNKLTIVNDSLSNAYNKIKGEYNKFKNLTSNNEKNMSDTQFKTVVKTMLQLNSVAKAMYSCCKKIEDIKQSVLKDEGKKQKSINNKITKLNGILSNIMNYQNDIENTDNQQINIINTNNGNVNNSEKDDLEIKTKNSIIFRNIKHTYNKIYGNSNGKTEQNVIKIINALKNNIKESSGLKKIANITLDIKTCLFSKDEITIKNNNEENKNNSLTIKVGRNGFAIGNQAQQLKDIQNSINEFVNSNSQTVDNIRS